MHVKSMRMKTLSEIVAENLIMLRKKNGLTQQDLADRLCYSDKTVSKWELGKAIPSVDVLKELADFYGVTVDYLISENNEPKNVDIKKVKADQYNHIVVVALLATIVYLIATVIFVWTCIAERTEPLWQVYIWGTAGAALLVALFVRKWWHTKRIAWLVFASLFVWALITGFYLQFLDQNIWYIFIIGVPVEILLVFVMMIRKG